MATKDCDRCPAHGKRVGEVWRCTHCGEKFKWDGKSWVYVGGGSS